MHWPASVTTKIARSIISRACVLISHLPSSWWRSLKTLATVANGLIDVDDLTGRLETTYLAGLGCLLAEKLNFQIAQFRVQCDRLPKEKSTNFISSDKWKQRQTTLINPYHDFTKRRRPLMFFPISCGRTDRRGYMPLPRPFDWTGEVAWQIMGWTRRAACLERRHLATSRRNSNFGRKERGCAAKRKVSAM